MGHLAHLTTIFTLANGKRSTIGMDIECRLSPGPGAADFTEGRLIDLAQAAYDGWSGTPNLQDSFANDVELVQAQAYSYDFAAATPPATGFIRALELGPFASAGVPVAGIKPGTSATPQVAEVVSFRTALASRSGRGRVYLPPLVFEDIDADGVINTTPLAELNTRFDDWVTGILNSADVGVTYHHIVASLKLGSAQEVTSRTVRSRCDTQRRRLTRETA